MSPKNLRRIRQPNVFKVSNIRTVIIDALPQYKKAVCFQIKEEHRRASKRVPASTSADDVLSLALAYNIPYMHEYVRYQVEINDKKKLSATFLTKGITADQRRLIVNYLIKATVSDFFCVLRYLL